MQIEILKSKIHRVKVTSANVFDNASWRTISRWNFQWKRIYS